MVFGDHLHFLVMLLLHVLVIFECFCKYDCPSELTTALAVNKNFFFFPGSLPRLGASPGVLGIGDLLMFFFVFFIFYNEISMFGHF